MNKPKRLKVFVSEIDFQSGISDTDVYDFYGEQRKIRTGVRNLIHSFDILRIRFQHLCTLITGVQDISSIASQENPEFVPG
jgi:hypothetical protein